MDIDETAGTSETNNNNNWVPINLVMNNRNNSAGSSTRSHSAGSSTRTVLGGNSSRTLPGSSSRANSRERLMQPNRVNPVFVGRQPYRVEEILPQVTRQQYQTLPQPEITQQHHGPSVMYETAQDYVLNLLNSHAGTSNASVQECNVQNTASQTKNERPRFKRPAPGPVGFVSKRQRHQVQPQAAIDVANEVPQIATMSTSMSGGTQEQPAQIHVQPFPTGQQSVQGNRQTIIMYGSAPPASNVMPQTPSFNQPPPQPPTILTCSLCRATHYCQEFCHQSGLLIHRDTCPHATPRPHIPESSGTSGGYITVSPLTDMYPINRTSDPHMPIAYVLQQPVQTSSNMTTPHYMTVQGSYLNATGVNMVAPQINVIPPLEEIPLPPTPYYKTAAIVHMETDQPD